MFKFLKFLISFLLKQEKSLEEREILVPIDENSALQTEQTTNKKFDFSLFDRINNGVLIVTKTNILCINRVLLDMLEYEEEDVLQNMKSFLDNLFLLEKEEIFKSIRKVINSTRDLVFTFETSLKTKYSDFVPVNLKITKVFMDGQDAVFLSFNSIVELANYKNTLSKKQKQIDTLFNTFPVSLLINDYSKLYQFIKEQQFTSVEDIERWIEGKTIEQLKATLLEKIKMIGINKNALKHSASISGVLSGVLLDNKEDIIFLFKHLFLKKLEFSKTIVLNNDEIKYSWVVPNNTDNYEECIEYVLIFSSKVTSVLEKRLEANILKAYKGILQWQNDVNGRIIFCNSHFFEVFLKNYSYQSIVSMQYDGFDFCDLMDEARDNEKSRHFIKRIKPAMSSEKWLDVWYYPIVGLTEERKNEIIGYIGIAIDITKFSKQLEAGLRTYIYEGKLAKISSDSYKIISDGGSIDDELSVDEHIEG